MKFRASALFTLALSAAACYAPGERNQGAAGYPAVEYEPCCDGAAAVARAGDWGKFCPGGVDKPDVDKPAVDPEATTTTCYVPGERNQGAAGYPAVDYKPCCDGTAAVARAGDWGKFCPGGVNKPDADKPDADEPPAGPKAGSTCYAPGERNQGAAGYPAVDYKPCCDGAAAVTRAGDWGKFCPGGADEPDADKPATDSKATTTCYEPGERNQGAAGYPAVDYKPCCDGAAAVARVGNWGKFCPGGADKPETDKPDADKPDADKPDADKPDADKPDADKPDADKPDADKPDADKPDADKPDADKPDADKPDADMPDADKPDADKPAAPEMDTTCYGSGERSQGAAGYPAVDYKPCCDGAAAVARAGDWGKFCPGGGATTAVDPNLDSDILLTVPTPTAAPALVPGPSPATSRSHMWAAKCVGSGLACKSQLSSLTPGCTNGTKVEEQPPCCIAAACAYCAAVPLDYDCGAENVQVACGDVTAIRAGDGGVSVTVPGCADAGAASFRPKSKQEVRRQTELAMQERPEGCVWTQGAGKNNVVIATEGSATGDWENVEGGVEFRPDDNRLNRIFKSNETSEISYKFVVNTPGRYYVTAKTRAMDYTEHNDMWIKFNGGRGFLVVDLGGELPSYWNSGYVKAYHNKYESPSTLYTVDHEPHVLETDELRTDQTYEIVIAGRSTKFLVEELYIVRCHGTCKIWETEMKKYIAQTDEVSECLL